QWVSQKNDRNIVRDMCCMREWHNTTTYTAFLNENFVGESSQIRSSLVKHLANRQEGKHQWKELHTFFFLNVDNFTSMEQFG
ncbi:hypothetical protein PENTCL1PPCAC_515, partial [Pristionchus entomophagus]